MPKALTWTDWRGREVTRVLNLTLILRDYRGTPGHALLLIASNRHLSVGDLSRLLESEGIERSRSWIQRRRWLFSDPDAVNVSGSKPNADGQDARALKIIQANPKLSLRQLAYLLKERGIRRGKDWVMHNRGR